MKGFCEVAGGWREGWGAREGGLIAVIDHFLEPHSLQEGMYAEARIGREIRTAEGNHVAVDCECTNIACGIVWWEAHTHTQAWYSEDMV